MRTSTGTAGAVSRAASRPAFRAALTPARTTLTSTFAAALAVALLASGCEQAGQDAGRTAPADLGRIRLVSYDGCDDMLAGLRSAAARNVGPWGLGPPQIMYMDARSDTSAARAKTAVPEHSTTNVHEAGADEPDLVKTDGRRVVVVNRGVLRVVDAATRKVTGTLKLVDGDQGWAPADLLVSGDRALVLFSGGGMVPFGAMAKRAPIPGPRYVLVDLSGKPSVTGTLTASGSPLDARMTGSTVRIVVRSQPEIAFPDPGPDLTDAERIRRNRDVVAKAPVGAWLPAFETTDAEGHVTKGTVGCERVSHPDEYTGTSMLTVYSVDLAAGAKGIAAPDPISVAADGDTVYGTASSLYVTSNPRMLWPRPVEPPVEDAPKATPAATDPATPVVPVKSPAPGPGTATPANTAQAPRDEPTPSEPVPVPPTVTATAETASGTAAPETTAPEPTPSLPPEETEIHRFDIGAPGAPRYVASGKVPGRLLNQYSLSEYEGHLRVATTSADPSDPAAGERDSSSAVYVLDARTLGKVGEVGGLGRGERIYSVRFAGPIGYVVTFRQVDPLYTLDLRDPKAPRATGELKISGYSAYLHPAGDGRLIGIGQEASEKGRTLGTQVSLFDVSDPAAPRLLSRMFAKDSGSEAEWDPHAFLYWPATGTAVVPLNSWSGERPMGGALVLRIDDSSVTRTGTITHPRPGNDGNGRFAYDPGIRRSVVIGDDLWTVSDLGLKVSALDGLADRAWIPFG
ncbi:beta-propeller domain-containing protein [Streptosporangium sp. NPDC004379]|uniref:beta-propeller domain-containing protein n=1 Tax=Streptosporangium sp. NPDC004379 TaxID=3366189 RepID=UPI003684AA71